MVTFMVVNLPSTYNIILGQPTLNELRAIVSTYQLVMKISTRIGTREVKSDPRESRRCYLTVVTLPKKPKAGHSTPENAELPLEDEDPNEEQPPKFLSPLDDEGDIARETRKGKEIEKAKEAKEEQGRKNGLQLEEKKRKRERERKKKKRGRRLRLVLLHPCSLHEETEEVQCVGEEKGRREEEERRERGKREKREEEEERKEAEASVAAPLFPAGGNRGGAVCWEEKGRRGEEKKEKKRKGWQQLWQKESESEKEEKKEQ
ncbi:hypothetical protein BHE74_00009031 [Ensete ventricosum]|nr:hypothetical protein BHE74_00009031 [Ensete ventricosum]